MQKDFSPNQGDAKIKASNARAAFENSKNKSQVTSLLKDILYTYLTKAAELEHLLSMQYLFSAFSLKKYPEEFEDFDSKNPENPTNELRIRQIEVIRKWDAKILYVSRQEMEHLNLVQNLIAILGYEPFMFRPNFPVPADKNPFGEPINLMPFSKKSIEIFRYWEKPDHLNLKNPFREGLPKAMLQMAGTNLKQDQFNLENSVIKAWDELTDIIINEKKKVMDSTSIEELYAFINVYFYFLLTYKLVEGTNIDRIVEEHFGFNMELDPIVEGKYYAYVNQVITQIIEEGEGVWGVPPPLDSHFMVYQKILEEMDEEINHGKGVFDPALPVVLNPTASTVTEHHNVPLPNSLNLNYEESAVFQVTNEVAIKGMELFNQAYNVLNQMLYGFFDTYSIDYTTGIRPPEPNAFFRTSFYPFMTNVIRPLGEMVSRLPALQEYVPIKGKVPDKTAGPNFFYEIDQNASIDQKLNFFKSVHDLRTTSTEEIDPLMTYFIDQFEAMAVKATDLANYCKAKDYHMANYDAQDARDFDARFNYLSENLKRIAVNFECYWKGKIIAPIPSKNFQNFSNPYN